MYPAETIRSVPSLFSEGADLGKLQGLSSTQKFQVGVSRKNNTVSPLSLRERARVRGF
jgi:hypothetical protein